MANKKIKGLTVEIGGDSTKLGKALDESKKKSKSLQTELKQVEKLLKLDPKNVELVAQKQKILAEQVEETKKRLSLLKDEQGKVNEMYKKGEIGEEEYRKYQREVQQTEITLKNLETQLKNTGDQFAEVQRKSGAVTFQNAENKVDHFKGKVKDMTDAVLENAQKISEGFDKVGDGLEKAGSVLNKGSAAAAAVLAGSVASFKDLDDGYDVIVKKTGATDEKFDSLKKTADELFSGSTFDMTDIGNAIGEVNTRFGYTDALLQSVSEQYLQFAKINDADVSDSVSKTARIMQAWNLSADNLPDLLGQETGVAVGGLMDKVLDNNATFKEMGLSLEESITLMAQFEKNGVNDSTALTAMKAAVKNAAKEGKSLSEWLTQTVDDIKNASGETEALQKATELFGTKGAAEMANAIREGRIDFDNLSGSMGAYKDTVKKTYDATVDPLEESKKVINNLKLAGTELAATALKEGQPLIEDVIDGVKAVTNWLKKLTPEQKKTLTKAIEIVAVAGPAVTILGKIGKGLGSVVGIIPKVVNTVKSMTSATKGAEAAQIGLNAAQSASPVGALITLLSLLAAAITTYYLTTDEATMRAAFLTDEEDKLYRRIDDNIEKWKELKETREEACKEIEGQYGYYETLSEKLKEITDESGKIKEGYEEEAATIINVLNDAFGKEYEITDGVIQNYQQMQEEIDKLIQLQKAQAQQEAYSESYKEAISGRTQAWQDLQDAEKSIAEKDNKLIELREKYSKISTGKWVQTSTGKQWVRDAQKEQEKAGVLADIKYEEGQRENAVAKFKEYQQTYLESLNLIRNYEGVVSAIASKDSDAINEALTRMTNDFVTADNATQEMLENQHTKIGDALAATRKAYDEGAPGVTESMLESYRYLFSASQQEMRKFQENSNETVAETAETVKETAKDTVSDTATAIENEAPALRRSMGSAGELARDEFVINMENGAHDAKGAGKTLADNAVEGAESADTKTSGKNFVSGFINGLKDSVSISNLWNAAKNIGSTALNAVKSFLGIQSPSKEAAKLGRFTAQGFAEGLENGNPEALRKAEELAETARNALGGRLDLLDINAAYAPSQARILTDYSVTHTHDFQQSSEIRALRNDIGTLSANIRELADRPIDVYVDKNKLVGGTIGEIDRQLANVEFFKNRGV